MLPVKELARLVKKYVDSKGQIFIDKKETKESQMYQLLQKDMSYNSIAKELGYTDTGARSYKRIKSKLYSTLVKSFIHIEGGTSVQTEKSQILREFLAVRLMTLFGFYSASLPASKKLLQKCITYHMHSEAMQLSRILFRHYSTYQKQSALAFEYFTMAQHHQLVANHEMLFDWEYSKIRGMVGTSNLKSLESVLLDIISETDKVKHYSIRLQFIHFEMRYFLEYFKNNPEGQIEVCSQGMKYFKSLPFEHDLALNIFTSYMVKALLTQRELTKAELILTVALTERVLIGSQEYSWKEQLFRIYLYKCQLKESLPLLLWMKKNVNKTGFPIYKGRLVIYELYLDVLDKKAISMRKLHYNLNKIKQDVPEITVPMLIAKVIYYFRNNDPKGEETLSQLQEYVRDNLDKTKNSRTLAFIDYLSAVIDVSLNVHFTIPQKEAHLIDNLEIVNYLKLKDYIETMPYAYKRWL